MRRTGLEAFVTVFWNFFMGCLAEVGGMCGVMVVCDDG